MITLPVTAQMYHSLVQQQLPNSESTVCVTPMQVQNFIANSNNLCSSLVNNSSSSSTNTTYQIMTSTVSQFNNNNNRSVVNFPTNKSAIMPVIKSRGTSVVNHKIYKKKILNIASMPKNNSNLIETAATTKSKVVKSTCNNNNNNNEDCVKNKNKNYKNFSRCEKKIKIKPKIESKVSKKEIEPLIKE